MRESDYLMLSGIQHFYFCERQWALIHIEQMWQENQATQEGQLLHQKADNPYIKEKRKDIFISRAVPVISHKYKISGILDVVEFYKSENGIEIRGKRGLWVPYIVEYKRGKEKPDNRDVMQLVAQVICLEEMLDIEIEKSYLFYKKTKEKKEIIIGEELRVETVKTIKRMWELFTLRATPKAKDHKNCTKCSLFDLCIPKLTNRKRSVINYINSNIEENTNA